MSSTQLEMSEKRAAVLEKVAALLADLDGGVSLEKVTSLEELSPKALGGGETGDGACRKKRGVFCVNSGCEAPVTEALAWDPETYLYLSPRQTQAHQTWRSAFLALRRSRRVLQAPGSTAGLRHVLRYPLSTMNQGDSRARHLAEDTYTQAELAGRTVAHRSAALHNRRASTSLRSPVWTVQ